GMRLPFWVGLAPEAVGRLIEGDVVRVAGIEVGDYQLFQALGAFVQQTVILEQVDTLEHHVRAVRDNFLPVLWPELGNGCRHQAEITARIVDADVKTVAMVVDVILDVGSALPYQPPATVGPVGRQVTHFAGGVTVAREQQVSAAAGELNVYLEAL